MRQQVAAWHWLETIARKQHGNCTVDGALLSDLMLRNFLVKSPEAYTHTLPFFLRAIKYEIVPEGGVQKQLPVKYVCWFHLLNLSSGPTIEKQHVLCGGRRVHILRQLPVGSCGIALRSGVRWRIFFRSYCCCCGVDPCDKA
jgi:hypothetical protein